MYGREVEMSDNISRTVVLTEEDFDRATLRLHGYSFFARPYRNRVERTPCYHGEKEHVRGFVTIFFLRGGAVSLRRSDDLKMVVIQEIALEKSYLTKLVREWYNKGKLSK